MVYRHPLKRWSFSPLDTQLLRQAVYPKAGRRLQLEIIWPCSKLLFKWRKQAWSWLIELNFLEVGVSTCCEALWIQRGSHHLGSRSEYRCLRNETDVQEHLQRTQPVDPRDRDSERTQSVDPRDRDSERTQPVDPRDRDSERTQPVNLSPALDIYPLCQITLIQTNQKVWDFGFQFLQPTLWALSVISEWICISVLQAFSLDIPQHENLTFSSFVSSALTSAFQLPTVKQGKIFVTLGEKALPL